MVVVVFKLRGAGKGKGGMFSQGGIFSPLALHVVVGMLGGRCLRLVGESIPFFQNTTATRVVGGLVFTGEMVGGLVFTGGMMDGLVFTGGCCGYREGSRDG